MTNTEIIVNLATIIAKQNLEISELNTEVQHLHHELLATMNEADRKTEPQTADRCEECIHLVFDGYWHCECHECKYEPKTEPQLDKDINVRSKDEPQTDIHDLTDCDFCKDRNCKDCEGGKDEPQTEYRIGYYTPTNAEILKALEDEQSGKE